MGNYNVLEGIPAQKSGFLTALKGVHTGLLLFSFFYLIFCKNITAGKQCQAMGQGRQQVNITKKQ
jgi:hypothetical protein